MYKRIIIFLFSFVYFAYCNNGSYPVYYNHKVKQTKQKERGNNMSKLQTMKISELVAFLNAEKKIYIEFALYKRHRVLYNSFR